MVWDFCFWAIWAAKPMDKKKVLGANFEQLLRAFFSCFRGQYFFFNFYETPIASALKNCMIKFSKMKQIELFLHVFWGKNVSS